MGILRGGSVIILCLLLLLSFIVMDSFYVLGSSLKYNNVQQDITTVVQDISSGTSVLPVDITGNFNLTRIALQVSAPIKQYCQATNSTEYNFTYENYRVVIPCNQTFLDNPGAIINKTVQDVTYGIYYTQYDCSFFNCFSKTQLPFFLVSKKAMDYWMNKFYIMLIASLVLIFLIFLLVEEKQNVAILAGALLILAAIPILKLKAVIDFFAGRFSPLIDLFLKNTGAVFTLSLIIGAVLVAAGILLRFLGRNTLKKKVSVDDVKSIVRQEIGKEKQSQPQPKKQKTKKKR